MPAGRTFACKTPSDLKMEELGGFAALGKADAPKKHRLNPRWRQQKHLHPPTAAKLHFPGRCCQDLKTPFFLPVKGLISGHFLQKEPQEGGTHTHVSCFTDTASVAAQNLC